MHHPRLYTPNPKQVQMMGIQYDFTLVLDWDKSRYTDLSTLD